jgi:uncharacterized integral membrane protein
MKLSTVFVLVPVAAILTILAVANRQDVTFKLSPFAEGGPDAVVMPLFLLVFLSFLLGVLVGGMTMALRSGLKARGKRIAATAIANVKSAEPPRS